VRVNHEKCQAKQFNSPYVRCDLFFPAKKQRIVLANGSAEKKKT
jgi:hypothetical protein